MKGRHVGRRGVLNIVFMSIYILGFYISMHADYQDVSVCSTVAFNHPENQTHIRTSVDLIWYYPTFSHYF